MARARVTPSPGDSVTGALTVQARDTATSTQPPSLRARTDSGSEMGHIGAERERDLEEANHRKLERTHSSQNTKHSSAFQYTLGCL